MRTHFYARHGSAERPSWPTQSQKRRPLRAALLGDPALAEKILPGVHRANLAIARINHQFNTRIEPISEREEKLLQKYGIKLDRLDLARPDLEELALPTERISSAVIQAGISDMTPEITELGSRLGKLLGPEHTPLIKIFCLKMLISELSGIFPSLIGLNNNENHLFLPDTTTLDAEIGSGRLSARHLPALLEFAELESASSWKNFRVHASLYCIITDLISAGVDMSPRILERVLPHMRRTGLDYAAFTDTVKFDKKMIEALDVIGTPDAATATALHLDFANKWEPMIFAPFWDRLVSACGGNIFNNGQYDAIRGTLEQVARLIIDRRSPFRLMEDTVKAFERARAAGYFATEEMVSLLTRDAALALPYPRQIREEIIAGRFDPSSPFHASIAYQMLLEEARENPLIKIYPRYSDFLLMLRRYRQGLNGTQDQSVLAARNTEMLYLAYEASRLNDFIHGVLQRARELGKEVLVVQNLSYGAMALAPIRDLLEKEEGIRITSARIGSTECHHDPDYTRTDLFDRDGIAEYIRQKEPIIIVVDGSSSVSNPDRTSPHIPDSHIGYRNYFKDTPYRMEFWYPGRKRLWLREWKRPARAALPIDARSISGPIIIFAQSVIEHEAIPEKIREKIGTEHEGAFFDDRAEFVEAAFELTPRGPAFSSVFFDAARQAYDRLFNGGTEAAVNGEIKSLNALGLSRREQRSLVEMFLQIKELDERYMHSLCFALPCRKILETFGAEDPSLLEKILDGPDSKAAGYLLEQVVFPALKQELGIDIDFSGIAEFPPELRTFLKSLKEPSA